MFSENAGGGFSLRFLAVIALVVVALSQSVAAQDYKVGYTAFKRGDYATALRHWRPLANKGDAQAQSNLAVIYRQG